MRIVVDTNVLASAVYFGGKPFKLLKLIMEEQISAIASKEIVEEYEEILVRLQQKLLTGNAYILSAETMICWN